MTTDSERPDATTASELPQARAVRSTSGSKALIGILLTGVGALVVVGVIAGSVHMSKDGRITAGMKAAHADCSKAGESDCLPDVNYTDTTGVAYTRAQLAGKVVLVNFWATWCPPCKAEIPDLSRAYEKYKAKGVVFLGVMTDSNGPDSQQLLNFQSDFNMTYPIVRANSDLMVAFNYPDQLPTTLIYDRSGKQVSRHIGPLSERELELVLAQLVAQP